MTTQTAKLPRFFYRMPPRPCPYLGGRTEQNIFTELAGPNTTQLYDALTQAGFRRSHNVAYRPACPGCQACVPVRVVVDEFVAGSSLRRVSRLNADVTEIEVVGQSTVEQYQLFSDYVASRHNGGEMAGMSYGDYTAMVQDSPLKTFIAEYRVAGDRLAGACLVDRLGDGLSAVYSFFDSTESKRSLGSYMIIQLIRRSQELGLPYLYLGYWIAGSQKMAYKSRFRPLEGLGADGWKRLDLSAT